jgi:hypothetical protein
MICREPGMRVTQAQGVVWLAAIGAQVPAGSPPVTADVARSTLDSPYHPEIPCHPGIRRAPGKDEGTCRAGMSGRAGPRNLRVPVHPAAGFPRRTGRNPPGAARPSGPGRGSERPRHAEWRGTTRCLPRIAGERGPHAGW